MRLFLALAVWLVSIVLVLMGFLGVIISIMAIVDPAGAKAADDTDPFGPPPSTLSSSIGLAIYSAITLVGFLIPWLYHRPNAPLPGNRR